MSMRLVLALRGVGVVEDQAEDIEVVDGGPGRQRAHPIVKKEV